MDHFAGAPGAARRPGHRVRRRCAGELGCPRGGLCTRRHRRHVHPPGRRIAPVGRRGRRLGCAEPVRATRRATRGARGAERSHRRPQHRGAARRVFPPGPTAARRAGGVRQFRRLELRPTARPGIGGGRGAACCGPTSRRHRRGAGSENGRTSGGCAGDFGRRRGLSADRRRPAPRPRGAHPGDRFGQLSARLRPAMPSAGAGPDAVAG
ncbi:Uncharacterised protein [Mycobacterium tuberculosis]|uniref:Uncharacterized protein n=1 Tax=Mycobacterium tuberculosis TaxID=1773 RepID=A0A655AGP2_MYCTX|nr:Uncharacterised protein [Mycobacterium tuberculosis]CKT19095.1 Uncharacterised protein [Mycobacterium tuberculosis]CKV86599.1 Uncharacterised protein [Mycobacterium tuberculosis]